MKPTKVILQTESEFLTWDVSKPIEALLPTLRKIKIVINRGIDPIAVYKNKALPALSRSVWYPQPIIIMKIGIRLISKVKNKKSREWETKNFRETNANKYNITTNFLLYDCFITQIATMHACRLKTNKRVSKAE